eukprot:354775-Chlamydomonas_euryale.AAC.4
MSKGSLPAHPILIRVSKGSLTAPLCAGIDVRGEALGAMRTCARGVAHGARHTFAGTRQQQLCIRNAASAAAAAAIGCLQPGDGRSCLPCAANPADRSR